MHVYPAKRERWCVERRQQDSLRCASQRCPAEKPTCSKCLKRGRECVYIEGDKGESTLPPHNLPRAVLIHASRDGEEEAQDGIYIGPAEGVDVSDPSLTYLSKLTVNIRRTISPTRLEEFPRTGPPSLPDPFFFAPDGTLSSIPTPIPIPDLICDPNPESFTHDYRFPSLFGNLFGGDDVAGQTFPFNWDTFDVLGNIDPSLGVRVEDGDGGPSALTSTATSPANVPALVPTTPGAAVHALQPAEEEHL